jgi:hypothetical protein
MGFMGSREYYKQKKIVSDYFEPIIKKEKRRQRKGTLFRT